MNFATILAEVQSEFRRPDKVDLVKSRIKEVILSCHNFDKFKEDVLSYTTATLYSDAAMGCYSIDTSSLTRYRDVVSVQEVDVVTGKIGKSFDILGFPHPNYDVTGLFANTGVVQLGSALQIRLNEAQGTARKFYVQYLTDPDISSDTPPETWLMRSCPYLVVHATLASLWRSTGNAERASAATADAREQRMSLIKKHLVLGG